MSSRFVELNLNPDARTLRQFGFIALVGFGALALCARFEVLLFAAGLGGARDAVSGSLGAVGALSALLSCVRPTLNRPLWVALTLVTYPIGMVLSYVLMGVLFFCIIAPVGALLRALGKDPLEHGFSREAESYWSTIRTRREKQSYFRQF